MMPRKAVPFVLTSLLLIFSACDSNDSNDAPSSIEGVWTSNRVETAETDFVLRLNIEQLSNGAVPIVETIDYVEGDAETEEHEMAGEYDRPRLEVNFFDPTFASGIALDCTVESKTEMECETQLASGESVEIELTRQTSQ